MSENMKSPNNLGSWALFSDHPIDPLKTIFFFSSLLLTLRKLGGGTASTSGAGFLVLFPCTPALPPPIYLLSLLAFFHCLCCSFITTYTAERMSVSGKVCVFERHGAEHISWFQTWKDMYISSFLWPHLSTRVSFYACVFQSHTEVSRTTRAVNSM